MAKTYVYVRRVRYKGRNIGIRELRQTRTLDRDSNRLLEPDHRGGVMMHSSELPTCLIEQVAKIGDRAFLAIMVAHHLLAVAKKVSSGYHLAYFFRTIRSKR